MLRLFAILALACGPFSQMAVAADVELAPRELLILKTGTNRIWGTWVCAVIHKGMDPVELTFPVHLPKEASDFQPGEGLIPKDLSLSEQGLEIRKVFSPGMNVISVIFAVPVRHGLVQLNVAAKRGIPQLTLMTPADMLEVSSDALVFESNDNQEGQLYQVYSTKKALADGETLIINISGVPEGRDSLWILGGIFATTLLLGSALLAVRTHEELNSLTSGEAR